ncbi:MAG: Endoglucanase precursor [Firmicutes bacterium ADurb.Bin419]|nr:MAG: Endoglucanase precursor [Firmicutes bacterium ADurb.Bin419]
MFIFVLFGILCTSCLEKNIPESEKPLQPVPEEESPVVVVPKSQLPKLRVQGRHLKNESDENITLHGFAQTYSPFFNQNAWNNYDVAGCLSYNKGMIDKIISAGWEMNFVRMHMDPYWSDDTSKPSLRYEGHERFSLTRFKKYLDEVFIPMAEYAIGKGLYVVFRPPGVAPEKIAVGDDYNQFLELVWDIVAQHPKIKNNTDIMFELANEPIQILGPNGIYSSSGQGHFDNMKTFFQSVVNKIRENADNIIWIPGLAYQSSYSGFANNPIEGKDIGYAVHVYPGWYGSDTEKASVELGGSMGGGYESFQRGWDTQVKPVADIAPIMVTEMDWAPAKYSASWGKSFTGTAGGAGFGANFKYITDNTGNVSWLIFTECHRLAEFKNIKGVPGEYTFLNDPEACPWPTFHWYKQYASNGAGTDGELIGIEFVGFDDELTILTGGDRYLVVKAVFSDGTSQLVTSKAIITSSDQSIIKIEENRRLIALKDGSATVTVNFTSQQGDSEQKTVTVRASTFPLTKEMFNPSIFSNGTFDEKTKILITGQWGFGGWWYNNGVDLSGYAYLVVELGNDNDSGVSFRLFDENNYWSQPAIYNFGNTRKVVVELNNMYKIIGEQQVKVNPSYIYIIGFWSTGGKPIIIKNIFLSNTLD